MSTLYEMLLVMNSRSRRSVQGPPVASKQERMLIEILNDNIEKELETSHVAQIAGLKRDTTLKILERLEKSYDITSRVCTSIVARERPGKHSRTKVRKWTCHSTIVPRKEMK